MLIYLIQLTICWAALYLGYTLFLRPTTFFRLNRFYLLGTFVLSFFIPLMPWPQLFPAAAALTPESPAVITLPVVSAAPEDLAVFIQAAAPARPVWVWALLGLYGLGAILCLFRLLLGVARLIQWRMQAFRESFPEFELLKTARATQPFSFFKWLYWPQHMDAMLPEGKQIIEHEAAHIRQWHSLDLLITEVVAALFWFHPMPWLYGRALRNVHEYLADAAALRQGSKKAYGHLLIRQALMGTHLPLVHNFSPAQLKKRIHMMTRHKTRKEALLRYVLLLPLPLLLGAWLVKQPAPASPASDSTWPLEQTDTIIPDATAQLTGITVVGYTTEEPKTDSIRTTAEMLPLFKSDACKDVAIKAEKLMCSLNELTTYISKNIQYPLLARQEKIQGTVVISFVVDETGMPTQLKAVRDIGGGCATEAMRVLENTRWIPGMEQGVPVKVKMTLPVAYKLPQEEAEKTPAATVPMAEPRGEEVFIVVEEMPVFGGCEVIEDKDERKKCSDRKVFEFVAQKLKYPELARKIGEEGTVVVSFIIDTLGQVKNGKILREPGSHLGEEALRIVSLLPDWTPGKQRGRRVNVEFRLPIRFKLNDDQPSSAAAKITTLPPVPAQVPELELVQFNVSPNPSSGLFDLVFQGAAKPTTIKVFNVAQALVYQSILDGGFDGYYKGQLDLRKQPKGAYILVIQQGERFKTRTLTIQ